MKDAPGFYGVIIASMAIGLALVGLGVDPIRALYLSAIFNGLTAPPLILLIVILARSRDVLGEFRSGWKVGCGHVDRRHRHDDLSNSGIAQVVGGTASTT